MPKPHPTLTALTRLRAKYRGSRYNVPFPDLSTRPSPCTNSFGIPGAVLSRLAELQAPPTVIVSHLHKSSYQVLSRSEVQYAGRKV